MTRDTLVKVSLCPAKGKRKPLRQKGHYHSSAEIKESQGFYKNGCSILELELCVKENG
jgi:hypothetical protein